MTRTIRILGFVAWFEMGVAVALLAVAVWPFSGYCSGYVIGFDCESRAILSVNLFGPLGVLALTCGAWSIKTRSPMPQFILLLGIAVLAAYWLYHAL